MTHRIKFVALALGLILLTGTLSAFADCLRPAPAGMMHCPPDCPMMMQQSATGNQVQLQFQEDAQPGSCCKISSGKPVPASTPQAPAYSSVGIVSLKSTPAMLVPALSEKRTASVPIRADASPQAVLCTFLI